jgi:hypothetical protein
MAKLYILAIGGSGARVVRSLTMFLTSYPSLEELTNGKFEEIVPILIDTDCTNGSLLRTKEILNAYESLNKAFSSSGYFRTKISKYKDISQQAKNEDGSYLRLVDVTSDNSTEFKDYIDLIHLEAGNPKERETAKLIKLLFSGRNDGGTPLLDLKMDEGFQGNPNIGSIVMSKFADEFLSQMPLQINDEVLFITSIFGGTGAAGFPAFLARMRADTQTPGQNDAPLKIAKVGAISLLPYYGLPKTEKQINSSHFIPKTKSALNYYLDNIYPKERDKELENKSDANLETFYYIAHEFSAQQPKNQRGGKSTTNQTGGQDNPAFFAEFMAALAILDYATIEHSQREKGKIKFKQIANIKNESPGIGIGTGHLEPEIESAIKKPLEKLSLMSKYLSKEFFEDAIKTGYAWTKNLKFTNGEINKTLDEFLTEFKRWESDLKTTGQKFIMPNKEIADIHTWLSEKSKDSTSSGIEAFLSILNTMENE